MYGIISFFIPVSCVYEKNVMIGTGQKSVKIAMFIKMFGKFVDVVTMGGGYRFYRVRFREEICFRW